MTVPPRQPPFAQPGPPPYPPYAVVPPKPKGLARLRQSTAFHVAVTAAAGAAAAYYGTTKAVRGHTIDVYFKIEDELDRIAHVADKKKPKKSKKKD